MTRRMRREPYIDPDVLPEPGRCLYADGIYRRRHGLPDKPEVLAEEAIGGMVPELLAPYRTESDRDRQPGHFNEKARLQS